MKQEYETSSDEDDSSDESGESGLFAARNEHPAIHMDDDCKCINW